MKLGIKQEKKLFKYLQGLDWEKDSDPEYVFYTYVCSYVAIDKKNELIFDCVMKKGFGFYSSNEEYKIKISSPGISASEEITGKFAKKVYDWIKEDVHTVSDEIKQMKEDTEKENKAELKAIIRSLIR